jgi:DNA polymerase IV
MQRLVCHVDMDAFFVSVEELFDPLLVDKPVVVGGKANQRGVVAAASYAARKFGIHSAMPLRTAARLCPHAIFVEGHPSRYREYSKKVFNILGRFSPQVEMASIDEAYLELTGTERLHGPPLRTAHTLHETIRAETSLKCSLGLASSRLVAKVSSGQAKPNGILYVLPGQEARFLTPLDVRKIPGVGKQTEAVLHKLGIRQVSDLAMLDESLLASHFGRCASHSLALAPIVSVTHRLLGCAPDPPRWCRRSRPFSRANRPRPARGLRRRHYTPHPPFHSAQQGYAC